MKKPILLLTLSVVMLTAMAQITVGRTPERYYTSLSDMKAGNSVEMPFTDPELNYNTGMLRFRPDDKALKKKLKKEARLVVHKDSLYLNMRKLTYQGFSFDAGYVQAWTLNDSTLLFFAPDNGWKSLGKTLGVGLLSAGVTMGMTGGAFAMYPVRLGNWACFLYQGDSKKVKRVDRELAIQLLKEGIDPKPFFDYMALSESNQKQQGNIKLYLYRLVHLL